LADIEWLTKRNTSTNYKRLLERLSLQTGLTKGEVLERLNQLAMEYAQELQAETGIRYGKSGEKRDIWLFPPYRLLAMNLILSYWIGWLSVPKSLHLVSDWKRIEDAYDEGRNAYIEYKMAKGDANNETNAKT
jgi:hypothetical protein